MLISGKVVYFVDGHSFENDKNSRNGRQKAIDYCLANFIDTNKIKKFDSRTERDRYLFLLEEEKKGNIKNLADHFKILIQPEFENANGDIVPALVYESDFAYFDNQNKCQVIEDVKGSEYFIDERFITIKQVFDNQMKDKKMYIRVILLRNKERVEYHLGEKKKSKKLLNKQREKIKLLQDELKEKQKKEKLKNRLEELQKKGKLTKREKERVEQLTKMLAI